MEFHPYGEGTEVEFNIFNWKSVKWGANFVVWCFVIDVVKQR